ARGGSKGLPGKNIYPLCGKPLIAYSIEAAQRCEYVERIIVSTDSHEIAEAAIHHGAEVPFLRPFELSGDKADLGSVIANALETLEYQGYSPDSHIVLLPTSPFRTKGLLDHLCSLLGTGYKTVNTVRTIIHPAYLYGMETTGKLYTIREEEAGIQNKLYFRNYGLFGGANKYGQLPNYAQIIDDPIMLIDIDTFDDMRVAESILQMQIFDFDAADTGSEKVHA
ncbi:MAG: acylneuraminate cytidylyltransferase family protein, partial [Desulfamplus sp.]|nr:acylneuraminate cytidylyltransferase family protein [Desulfamplus sp.]